MPYVWMDDVQQVDSYGVNGRGMVPPIADAELDKLTGNVRGTVVTQPVNSIPNPNAVTSGDNLVSDNGAWSGAAPQPPEICVVTGTVDEETDAVTLDKSYADIRAAVEAGKLTYLISVTDDDEVADALDIAYLAVSFIGVVSDVYTVIFGTDATYEGNTETEALVDADHFVPVDDGGEDINPDVPA